MSVPQAIAADNPITYFNDLCSTLPRLLREGGSPGEVERATAGLMNSLVAFNSAARGAVFRFDLYPARWGWSATCETDAGPDLSVVDEAPPAAGADLVEVRPAFERDGDVGLLLLPAPRGWRHWHPARGPCPPTTSGRLHFGLAVVHGDGGRATFCEFREKWGDDLPYQLYATSLAVDPSTPAQQARLVGVLRDLARRAPAGGDA